MGGDQKVEKKESKMLGLQTGEAQAFDKWSVRWKPFLRAVHEVKYNNGYLSQALKAQGVQEGAMQVQDDTPLRALRQVCQAHGLRQETMVRRQQPLRRGVLQPPL